jgi:hypothetical protein
VHQMLHPILARQSAERAAAAAAHSIAVRAADPADVPVLERLAALDTAPIAAVERAEQVRDGGVLVAESGGRVVAALGLRDGLAVADPFARTASVVALLRMRAAELARARAPRFRLPRLRPRLA